MVFLMQPSCMEEEKGGHDPCLPQWLAKAFILLVVGAYKRSFLMQPSILPGGGEEGPWSQQATVACKGIYSSCAGCKYKVGKGGEVLNWETRCKIYTELCNHYCHCRGIQCAVWWVEVCSLQNLVSPNPKKEEEGCSLQVLEAIMNSLPEGSQTVIASPVPAAGASTCNEDSAIRSLIVSLQPPCRRGDMWPEWVAELNLMALK